MSDGKVNRSVLQMRIVTAVSKEPGLSVTEIAEKVDSSRPAVSRSIHSLRDDGVVRVHERKWYVTDVGRREAAVYSDRFMATVEQVAEQAARLAEVIPPKQLAATHQAIQDALAPGFHQLLKDQQQRWRELLPNDVIQDQIRALSRVVPDDYLKSMGAAPALFEAAKLAPQIEDVIGRFADLQIAQASFTKHQLQIGDLGGAAADVLRQHHRSIASIADNLFAIRQLSTIGPAQRYLTESAAVEHLDRMTASLADVVRSSGVSTMPDAAWHHPASTGMAIDAVGYYSHGVRRGAEAEVLTENDGPSVHIDHPEADFHELDLLLGAVEPRWVEMRRGAWDALRRQGPDCYRHAAVSQRELITQVILHYIPDAELPTDPETTPNGTRLKARLKILLGSKSRAHYATSMIDAILLHHGQLCTFTHTQPGHEQALYGILRMGDGFLHFMLSVVDELEQEAETGEPA
jgi:DNA-binding GntR family transcriptional regulator